MTLSKCQKVCKWWLTCSNFHHHTSHAMRKKTLHLSGKLSCTVLVYNNSTWWLAIIMFSQNKKNGENVLFSQLHSVDKVYALVFLLRCRVWAEKSFCNTFRNTSLSLKKRVLSDSHTNIFFASCNDVKGWNKLLWITSHLSRRMV